jgi:non-heme chloroperoxidase
MYRACAALLLCLLAAAQGPGAFAADTPSVDYMFHEVIGAEGLPLNVVEVGNPQGIPVVFLHGFSQSYLSWVAQLDDPDLQRSFRMIALDLRGHGASGKPWDPQAYAGHEPWADDLTRVMDTLGIVRPWLVGWSFGGFVALDYVREHGEQAVSGLVFTGSHGGLIARPVGAAATITNDLQEAITGAHHFMRLMGATPLPDEVREAGAFSRVMLPPYARRAMTAKRFDNTDLLERLSLPLRLIMGEADGSMPLEPIRSAVAHKRNIEISVYPSVGHSPFIEARERFNSELRDVIK